MDTESADVQEKAQASLEYCKYATDFTIPNGGKPWKYVLIPHHAVMVNMSFLALAMKYEYQDSWLGLNTQNSFKPKRVTEQNK